MGKNETSTLNKKKSTPLGMKKPYPNRFSPPKVIISDEDDNEHLPTFDELVALESIEEEEENIPTQQEMMSEDDEESYQPEKILTTTNETFPPYCNCVKPEACVSRTSGKVGINFNKQFWVCGNKNQMAACSFFLWKDNENLFFDGKERKNIQSTLRTKTMALVKLRAKTNLRDPVQRQRLDSTMDDYLNSMSKYFLIHQ